MELQVFNSTELGSVRTATANGEVMFVGRDVAAILGYQNGSRDINRHVDEEDRHNIGSASADCGDAAKGKLL